MSGAVAVRGVGTSHFARQPHTPARVLAWQAVTDALADAGAAPGEVEAVFAGTVFGDPGVTTRSLQHLGITGVPIVTVENACASGTTAFHEARVAAEQGRYEVVLALGIETMTAVFDGPIEPLPSDPEGAQGFAMPSLYAMAAQRYLHCHAVTPAQLAQVSVKNRRHALANPRAQHAADLTVTEVLGSRMISDPLTLLQCCDIADAAAAAVVGPARPAGNGGGRDVAVRASALASGGLWDHTTDLVWGWQLVADTARTAYEQAGVGPSDIDVFEVHDAFTIGEIVSTEALGLCELGGGGALVASGRTGLGGAQPVNPSGGLLSRGHPVGATGLGQIAEIVWQLRGAAGGHQVPGARLGVVETMGGGTVGIDGNGLHALLAHPEQLARLRARPDDEYLRLATEEILRFDGPSKMQVRMAAGDIEMEGRMIRRHDMVYLVQAAANRDPEVFDDPDRFDLERNPTDHLGFGFGLHYCLGAAVARLEGAMALDALVRRLPDLRLGPEPPEWHPTLISRGMHSLPVQFTPGDGAPA